MFSLLSSATPLRHCIALPPHSSPPPSTHCAPKLFPINFTSEIQLQLRCHASIHLNSSSFLFLRGHCLPPPSSSIARNRRDHYSELSAMPSLPPLPALFPLLLLLLLPALTLAADPNPTLFCKCLCPPHNSTIIPATTCGECNRQFCIDYKLPACLGVEEEDVTAVCIRMLIPS